MTVSNWYRRALSGLRRWALRVLFVTVVYAAGGFR